MATLGRFFSSMNTVKPLFSPLTTPG
jgi:hypothetical protein